MRSHLYFTSTFTALLFAGVTFAQDEAPPVPAPANQATAKANKVDPNTPIKEDIAIPLMDGYEVAKYYSKWTGKRVIIPKAAQALEISFIQDAPLTYGEAADLLVKTCFLEGLVFVPSGKNEVKLLPAASVKPKGGYPLVTSSGLLPDTEELVTYAMHFENIKPEEAMSIFTGVISQVESHGSIVPVPNTNTLLITENSQLIRTLVEIKERIDIPQELSTRRWITLEHADAEVTAENVRSIMEFSAQQNTQFTASPSTSRRSTPSINTSTNRGGGNNAQTSNASNNNRQRSAGGESFSTVQVIADVRTNRIFVIGRPIDVEVAEGLIEGFDSPLDDRNFYKHKLKFLSVAEFIDTAQQAILQATSREPADQNNGGQQNRSNRNSFSRSLRNAANPNASFSQNNSGGNLEESGRPEGPEALIIGKTLLVADNSNNTLIINGPPQAIKVVKDLIKEMDVLTDQVQITAVFGRYNLNDSLNFGVDFARTFQTTRGASSGFAGQSRTGFPILADPESFTDLSQFGNVSGLSLYGKVGDHFNATLRAMESSGKFKLMARPSVFTRNNRRAVLSSGQQIAVPTNTFTQGGSGINGSQSTNIAFRDVLLELEVIPLVNSEDEVTLQISFTNNNIVGETVIDGNSIPTIGQESILTTVTVPHGETIILGGLITERDENTESGIPILRHIPGIKHLASTTEKDVVREELIIFIQPRITNGKRALQELQLENARKSQLAAEMQSGERLFPEKFSDPEKQVLDDPYRDNKAALWWMNPKSSDKKQSHRRKQFNKHKE